MIKWRLGGTGPCVAATIQKYSLDAHKDAREIDDLRLMIKRSALPGPVRATCHLREPHQAHADGMFWHYPARERMLHDTFCITGKRWPPHCRQSSRQMGIATIFDLRRPVPRPSLARDRASKS